MAEKQYKNYDERFLKEEASGSRPVIEYDLEDENEVTKDESRNVYLKGKFPDGSYCQSSQDMINLFISSPIISVRAADEVIYCSPVNIYEAENNALMYLHIGANDNNATYHMTDATFFEQLKQSKS